MLSQKYLLFFISDTIYYDHVARSTPNLYLSLSNEQSILLGRCSQPCYIHVAVYGLLQKELSHTETRRFACLYKTGDRLEIR